jgi:chorismate-pyruvate lyase
MKLLVVVVSVMVRDFGTHMMQKISELEEKSNLKLSVTKKILLAESGTVEQILSILMGTETTVKVLRQTENREIISREAYIISKKDGKTLLTARSYFLVRNLPKKFVDKVRRKQRGIGNIIADFELETFRKIIKIGYDSYSESIFKVYQILYKGKVAIEIVEYFSAR